MSQNKLIKVNVVEGNLLSFSADVLALKYSQALYPLDMQVLSILESTGIDLRKHLPKDSEYYLVRSQGAMDASAILFVGVDRQFGYKQLRDFGYRAIKSLAEASPEARHLSLTHYGIAYGLDEAESFKSQVAGLIEGIKDSTIPLRLEQISFVVLDHDKAQRLSAIIKHLLPESVIYFPQAGDKKGLNQSVIEDLRTVGYLSAEKPHVFVAMPFSDEMVDVYHYGIQGAVNAAGYLCERADLSSFTGDILEWVKTRIASSNLVIADLSGANANVYLEVGYAWGCKTPTILLVHDQSDLKFDVKGQRCLVYRSIKNLEELLRNELEGLRGSITHKK